VRTVAQTLEDREPSVIAEIQKIRFFPVSRVGGFPVSRVGGEGSYLIDESGQRIHPRSQRQWPG
jgi:hypothetical protein